ncbi:MAG: hypothetical protein IJ226_04720, partial [Clostridia bacterium]|nr:hypothetical protein [Clostridia bacterium]
MKIYAIYGKSNIGKTTVIKDLCERLKAKYNCKNYDLHVQDVCCVFDINGKKVGITSYGDNAEVLKAPFSFFEKENCDII